jgi:hypothetical protein
MVYLNGAYDTEVRVEFLKSRHMAVTDYFYLLHKRTASYQFARTIYGMLNDLTHNLNAAGRRTVIMQCSLTRLATLYSYAKRINAGKRSLKRTIRIATLTRICRLYRHIPPDPSITLHTALHDGLLNADVRAAIRHVMVGVGCFPDEDVALIARRTRVIRHTGPTALSILQNIKRVCRGYSPGSPRP